MDRKYDVIIVGSGIGGLVCGCYLARAGVKTLICEKHDKPGGYCTSFVRRSHRFDVAIHYLGGCRKNGQIDRILKELGLHDNIRLTQYDPTDKIVTPDHTVYIRSEADRTVEGLKDAFPRESRNIGDFFTFLRGTNFYDIYAKISKVTFRQMLDSYFKDGHLKGILSMLLGNIGLSDSRASALTATVLFRDFILNPGFYPEGGMQKFSSMLMRYFTGHGGSVMLNTEVKEILVRDEATQGVMTSNGAEIYSRFVVSNASAKETFGALLKGMDKNASQKAGELEVSISALAVYLGLNVDIKSVVKETCAVWYFTTYDMDECYGDTPGNIQAGSPKYVVATFPSAHDSAYAAGKSCVELFMGGAIYG